MAGFTKVLAARGCADAAGRMAKSDVKTTSATTSVGTDRVDPAPSRPERPASAGDQHAAAAWVAHRRRWARGPRGAEKRPMPAAIGLL